MYHYPHFFWVYVLCGLPLRMLAVRRSGAVLPKRAWLVSSAASVIFVFCVPFAALPAFLVVALGAGNHAMYSLLMGLPIAASVGAAAAMVDAVLFRVVLRETVNRKTLLLLFGTNALNVSVAIGGVLGWMAVYPARVVAALGSC